MTYGELKRGDVLIGTKGHWQQMLVFSAEHFDGGSLVIFVSMVKNKIHIPEKSFIVNHIFAHR